MKPLYSRTVFYIFFAMILAVFYSPSVKAQWFDKNESENYIARHECSVVQAGNKFYLMGGRESAKTIDVYDYAADTWTPIPNSAPEEFNHFQATEYKGLIWIIGAFKTNAYPTEQPSEFIWAFNPANKEWIKGPSIPPNRRRGSTGLVVYNDKFYISGGNTIGHDGGYVPWFDEYDPATGTWTPLEDSPRARDHFHAGVIGTKMYLAGGRLSGGAEGVFKPVIAEVDVYDFITKQWSTLSQNLPTPRGAPSIAIYNNTLVVIGGEVQNENVYGEIVSDALSITEQYDPATQVWTRIEDLNHKRHGTQAIVSGDGIFVLAGSPNLAGGNQKNMEYFGQNTPIGTISTASILNVPSSLTIESNTTGNFDIETTGGNVGVIVSSMQISGAGASNFQIVSGELTNALLDAGSSNQVTVAHNGDGSGASAILTISYGASSSTEIMLNVNTPTTYSILSSAGNNGTISPLGTTNVNEGSNQEYVITADSGFAIADVLVDENSIGSVANYTFNNVTQTHTISVRFEAVQSSHSIIATASIGGAITPSGDTNVAEGSDQEYLITADPGFTIADIIVDNVSVGANETYSFINVTENHNINALFTQIINQPPQAIASANLIEGNAPLSVDFDGSESTDDNGIIGYTWDFGDNSAITTNITPNHIFTEPGVYNVILSVEDSDGIITTSTINITVTKPTVPELPTFEIDNLLIYPNPASDQVIMILPGSAEIGTISLFDMSGKHLQTLIPNPLTEALGYTISVSALSTGIYSVKVIDIKGNEFQQQLLIRR